MSVGKIRTFFAIDPGIAVKRELYKYISALSKEMPYVKWVGVELLHITLKFCGEISAERLDDLRSVMGKKFRGKKPFSFEVRLGTPGAFPSLASPQIIWIGVGNGEESLADLASSIDNACSLVGIPKEKRNFHPHITVGRMRESGGASLSFRSDFISRNFEHLKWNVSEFMLMKSILKPQGPVYSVLQTFHLEK